MEVITLIQGDELSDLTPLFLIHAISGVALPFLRLESLSEDDRPVYGITSPVHCPGGENFKFPTSLADLAAFYISGIQTIQPVGPYLIGGWSMGGMVAMFMAQILEGRGEQVSKVIMIDSANPEAFPQFSDATEHRALARATFEKTIACGGLQMGTESSGNSPIPSPQINSFQFDDYVSIEGRRPSSPWVSTMSDNSARSSASSFFSNSASSLFDSPLSDPGSPMTPTESVCDSDEEFDCDFDDEPAQIKDFLRLIKLHVHLGLELISKVGRGDLFQPNKKSGFDTVLIKCSLEDWPMERQYDLERLQYLQKVMSEPNMRWNTNQFRSFRSIPFSGDHDGAFQPQFVGELSSILRECLEDVA